MSESKNIIIIGGTGFVGRHLSAKLISHGYSPIIISRKKMTSKNGIKYAEWDGKNLIPLKELFEDADAIVNLAGKNINCRWNKINKKEILDSRINSADAVGGVLQQIKNRETAWIQASAVGYYGDAQENICIETSNSGIDFLAGVCKKWEKAAVDSNIKGNRQVILRIGGVLAEDGGLLKPLEKLTKFFLGSHIGNGKQYISWIHIDDLTSIIYEAVTDKKLRGVYNASAPNPVNNLDFMKTLRNLLKRPYIPPVPVFLFRFVSLIIGIPYELITNGQKAIPQKLLDVNFKFNYPYLYDSLKNLLQERCV